MAAMALRGTKPERYSKIIEFYEKGEANASDFLLTDLAEWPKRLDIVRPPDFPVTFKSSWSDIYSYIHLMPSLRSLFLASLIMQYSPSLSFTFLSAMIAKNSVNIGGYVKPQSKPGTVHLNPIFRVAEKHLAGRRLVSEILSHEFKHVLQARDMNESLSSSLKNDRLNIQPMLLDDTKKHVKYLAEECELQARLHTLIIGAYHQYGFVPITRDELFHVLKAQGVNIPDTILEQHNSPDMRHNNKLYERYADDGAVSDFNDVIKSIKNDRLLDFIETVIPFIYGDMIELWGDRLGHKRMGHTHNIQLREVFYRAASEYDEAVNTLRSTQQTKTADELKNIVRDRATIAQEMITHMPQDDAVDLACMLASGVTYKEFGEHTFISTPNTLFTQHALKQILQRSDVYHSPQDVVRIREAFDTYSIANRCYKAPTYAQAKKEYIDPLNPIRTVDIYNDSGALHAQFI